MPNYEQPEWWTTIPAAHQRVLTNKASRHDWRAVGLTGHPVRVHLRGGETVDGTYQEDRGFFTGVARTYSIGIRVPGRKTLRWIAVSDIFHGWVDNGPTLAQMFGELITGEHDREERYLGSFPASADR